jgi:hypothetical protein
LVKVIGQLYTPAALPLGNERQYPLKRRLGGPQSQYAWFWRRGSILPLPGFETLTVQPVASHYTSYAVLTLNRDRENGKFMERLSTKVKGN